MVLTGEVTLSVTGRQDNSFSLMAGAVHVKFDAEDGGLMPPLIKGFMMKDDGGGGEETLFAILAVLATHKIGSIPNFPSVEKQLLRKKRLREKLRDGKVAGSLPAIHKSKREVYEEYNQSFQYHLGAFVARACQACADFMSDHSTERAARAGVALWNERPLRPSLCAALPNADIVSLSSRGEPTFSVASEDNRHQRKAPKPKDFGNANRVLTIEAAKRFGGSEAELAGLGSYPLLDMIEGFSNSNVAEIQPRLAQNCTMKGVRASIEKERALVEEQARDADKLKEDASMRPRLDIPMPLDSRDAKSPIGASMIERIEKSMIDHRFKLKAASAGKTELVIKKDAQSVLSMYKSCVVALRRTKELVRDQVARLEEGVNRANKMPVAGASYTMATGYLRAQLRKQAWLEPDLQIPFVLGSLLARDAAAQIRDANPLLSAETISPLMDSAALFMFRCSRIMQLQRCINALEKSFPSVRKGTAPPADAAKSSSKVMSGFKNWLCGRRHYTEITASGTLNFDPRYLCFEFLSGFLLWKRQCNLVREFSSSARSGSSQAQQMIMGDGKTTVVGPLLALIMGGDVTDTSGDGRLVTLVCPKALLQQSKTVMRTCFSSPITPKPLYTLKFDRGFDSRVSTLRKLRKKIVSAGRELGVVVAAPTSIKSYFLKYVELVTLLRAEREGGLKGPGYEKREKQKTEAAKKRAEAAAKRKKEVCFKLNNGDTFYLLFFLHPPIPPSLPPCLFLSLHSSIPLSIHPSLSLALSLRPCLPLLLASFLPPFLPRSHPLRNSDEHPCTRPLLACCCAPLRARAVPNRQMAG